ncbi:hypothetical protein CAPTEDRAFT_192513 [Capitella teleta]|uniref:G-protein coupled receptors family 1 profile domain-containing protein n=1 Tax=Capitella teleta TaxID=283909 RepID=R7USV9_CAPTE|nr:hypothetical protein CAPTEDRAFT_192513 [Capitella teleta]|eukprot:ELU09295.1 hypothetical protein CAPTEDRAFT_192513 [Capitella teleta]
MFLTSILGCHGYFLKYSKIVARPALLPWTLYSTNISGVAHGDRLTIVRAITSRPRSILAIVLSVIGACMNLAVACILIKGKIWQTSNRNAFLLNQVLPYFFGSLTFGNLGTMMAGLTNNQGCIAYPHIQQWSYMTSWMSLLGLMLDQYLCIEWPLIDHPIWMTPTAITALIAGAWGLPAINFCLFKWVIGGEHICDDIVKADISSFGIHTVMTLAGIPLPLVLLLNLRIIYIAKRRANEVFVIQVASLSGSKLNGDQELIVSSQSFVQIWKSILTANIIIGSTFVSVLPCTVFTNQFVANPPTELSQLQKLGNNFSVGVILIGACFTLNPLIFRLPQTKKFYTTTLRKLGSC